MKVVGTIVEYNPLHNGHIYAVNKIKKESKADVIIAVMSGDFTMRGDLSIYDKFSKTLQALKANIDVIIELPFVYTVQSSDLFAYYAVSLLKLAKVEELWVGSESNDLDTIYKAYEDWKNMESQKKIKSQINGGISYKKATSSIINLPSNDILAFSYYKAIKENSYNITLKTIKREGSLYYDTVPDKFASAYAIRKDLSLIDTYCPKYLKEFPIRDYNLVFNYLKFQILNQSINSLKSYFFVDEGLENKLKDIKDYDSYDEFVNFLVSKRYTRSRIQRMLTYILFGIKKEDMATIKNEEPSFLRILGYNQNGLKYIKTIKKSTSIYTNLKEGINSIIDINLKISKILDLIYVTNEFKNEQAKPIILE